MIQMKTKNLLMVMALSSAAIFESCTDKPAQTIGFKLENMDQSVKPGTVVADRVDGRTDLAELGNVVLEVRILRLV